MMEGPMMPDNIPTMSNTTKILLLINDINERDEEISALKRQLNKQNFWVGILSALLFACSIAIVTLVILMTSGGV